MKRCSHCHLEYPDSALKHSKIGEEDLYFCCNGCESVYFLLKQSGFDGFYDKLGQNTLAPVGEKAQREDLTSFDTPAFAKKYIYTKDGLSRISLILEGIHCAACVWLNEKILNAQEGVYDASVHYTNNRVKITFDPSKITPSKIISLIRSIGYDAYAYDPKIQEIKSKKERRRYYIALIVAIFCTMNIMWIAVAQYAGYFLGITQEMKNALNLVSFFLSTPVLFYTGKVFFVGAYYGLKNRFVGMDLLVCVGASLTYFYSVYAALSGIGETYFESVAMIITIVFAGKFLEIKSKRAAGDALDKLNSKIPNSVIILEDSQRIAKMPQEVKVGDIVEVLPGESLALDGYLIGEEVFLDTRALNGESLPLKVQAGEEIFSGYVNTDKSFIYRVSKPFEDSLMSRLVRLLEDCIAHKPHIQTLANSLSQHFSKAVLGIGALSFLGWHYLGGASFEHSLIIAISVIVISCPCALALATPIATVVGLGEAYKKGLVFKEASFLESMAKAHKVLLDKTGTLSAGEPGVVNILGFKAFDKKLLSAFVSQSKHPISQSIAKFLGKSDCSINDFSQSCARGIQGISGGKRLYGGSLEYLHSEGVKIPKIDGLDENMVFGYAIERELMAVFLLRDELKKGAKDFIDALKKLGVGIEILSGDREAVVKKVSRELGIENYQASLKPEEKGQVVDNCHQKGEIVIMVGDGINDTLALGKSDVGISMGAGSDIAIASSDVVVLDDKLSTLLEAFKISKRTYKIIKQNIALSIIYNALMIPLAIAGFVIPLIAALSMSASSFLVVLNSLRIRK
ncbi:copper-translocating P-type ATPase [Helicobacter sp. 12S02232-10]|uniref:heavy metal translocating P-type ATPase n=1 Tax=Helicobacter sp. 12S02232-10 TaxID=1476197 RepID=UPI000BA4FE8E|nr:heavy metal translocating P-type ATPase [Helicobacter sp. 12S02232-10]PAF49534.1 copper-translocating P-type ATPase [Helicobacter sp. 12S02232-10]